MLLSGTVRQFDDGDEFRLKEDYMPARQMDMEV